MFAAIAGVIVVVILCIGWFANKPGPGKGRGHGKYSASGPGIILQHSGQFPPNEFVFEGEMRGVSPDYARMLEDKGYYTQAKCPGAGFVHTEDPRFRSIVTVVNAKGNFLQSRGDNLLYHALDNRHKVCGAAGDWGNTTTRRRFATTSSAYIKAPINKLICATNATATCPEPGTWNGTQVVWEAEGFVTNSECLADNISADFIVNSVVVPNNIVLATIVGNNPGTFALVPESAATVFENANQDAVILAPNMTCSPGWGFLLNHECDKEATCLTDANLLVTAEHYNEHCCQYRNPKYDAEFPNWVANYGISFGESAFNLCIDDRTVVNDVGGPELSIAFEDCGDNFCDRPGDAACP